jgi:RecB family exonuclease
MDKHIMATSPAKQLISWSFSRYNDYRTCPAKAKYKHIEKRKEPPSPAMERGAQIHTLCEQYVKGLHPTLPPELKLFKGEFLELRKMYKAKKLPMIVEDNWAFDKEWGESTWNDWMNCWVRIKLDMARYTTPNRLHVTDYKTGKMSEWKVAEYMEQLELYVLAALLMSAVEDVEVVADLWFLDHGEKYPAAGDERVYTRADLPALLKSWTARVKPMMADKRFAPTPSANACRYCFFKKENGGPCQF